MVLIINEFRPDSFKVSGWIRPYSRGLVEWSAAPFSVAVFEFHGLCFAFVIEPVRVFACAETHV